MPLLTHPLALLTALTIPALLAIYFLRNRFKRRTVTALFLWQSPNRPREGGTIFRRMHSSWMLLLEIIALAALTIAAANPRVLHSASQRPLIVILDNSASMLAGNPSDTPRAKAITSIHKAIKSGNFKSAAFILASAEPELLDVTTAKHLNNRQPQSVPNTAT